VSQITNRDFNRQMTEPDTLVCASRLAVRPLPPEIFGPKWNSKQRGDFIVTIDRSDASTAFIKVRCQLPPRYFTDYLVAMKLADGWQIVSKSYRYDLKE
jgi:Putative lumazine-binding